MPRLSVKNLSFLLLLAAGLQTYAQTPGQYVKEGDRRFRDKDFYGAALHYRTAWQMDSSSLDVAYKYAEASRLYNEYPIAAQMYALVWTLSKKNDYPLSVFWLAMMKKAQGNYPEAKKYFQAYCDKNKGVDYYFKKSAYEISACDYAIQLKARPINVTITHPDSAVNTVYSDFGAYTTGDTLLHFSSLRIDESGNTEIQNSFSKLYHASQKDATSWNKAVAEDSIINFPELHNGNGSFSADGKRFYFTRCHNNDSMEIQCSIFISELQNGVWQEPREMDENVNVRDYTSTQPCVSRDSTGTEYLYFASDRPGGEGKMDIWRCTLDKEGKPGPAQNAGKTINSIDNEISPFTDNEKNTLYFSSDWWKGLGGFDIFSSARNYSDSSWSEPENLGYPLNTSYNDLYYTIEKNGIRGFLTSNRPGSYFTKGETCCNDIYSFSYPRPVKDTVAQITAITPKPAAAAILMPGNNDLEPFLPLTLYFHNDQPDPRTTGTKTQRSYDVVCREYLALKEKYISRYTKNLTGQEKVNAEQETDEFFKNYVKAGYDKLETFSGLLLAHLQRGDSVHLVLKGYCSPLASTKYNHNLAKRRISSLVNYLLSWQHGALKNYTGKAGLFIITEEDIGELEAPRGVSDNAKDKRNSVYSPHAAYERRIQITGAMVIPGNKK